jgi:serine/threonine-protein kinase
MLNPGDKLGPYAVTAKLGEGGMGVVFRATDTKLGRDVALKVLPEAFAVDAQRMQRFQREAQVLASLNHPHIAAIYGLEEAGAALQSSGPPSGQASGAPTRALVMELVEGPTLAERIAQGAIPFEEALPIAKQIAEALEYAHERGIIHRDLKPANIKLTADGQVKVLDFGLAKALADDIASSDVSASPTLSMAATKAGYILGTAAYMSPEQAKGKPVDRRTDVWAFGCVLYEMLMAKHAFPGEDVSETLAAIIRGEPDWNALPRETPTRVHRLLRRCLDKDIKRRLQAIGEARITIEEAIAHPETAPMGELAEGALSPPLPMPLWRRPLPWAGLAGALAVGLLLTVWAPWRPAPEPPAAVRVNGELGADVSLARPDLGASATLSADGTLLAFIAQKSAGRGQTPQLYVRRLDQLQALPLPGTDGAREPFFSPDGQWIGFFDEGKLKKISVGGGPAVTLCDVQAPRGGFWADDDTIIFAVVVGAGLSRVPAAGGAPQPLTTLDQSSGEITHRWPQVLPGGQAVLFTAHNSGSNFDEANLVVQSLDTGQRKIVHRGGYYGRYLPSGHLVYMREGTLFAAPFDLERLEITRQPAPALERVTSNSNTAGAQFTFSRTGTLAYLPGETSAQRVTIQWMDRDGKTQPLRSTPGNYLSPRFSPDGQRLALEIDEGTQQDVWVYEWQRDRMVRLTFDAGEERNPVWTPDGGRITFSSRETVGGLPNLYWKRADGIGDVQRLTQSKNSQQPGAWHPSGKFLVFEERDPQTGPDILILPMEGDEKSGWKPGTPAKFVNDKSAERDPAFSPDGRWVAYTSNQNGRSDVFVRPFPGPGGKWQISTEGGQHPAWSPNGKELFFRSADRRIMVAGYTAAGDSFTAGTPRLWSEGTNIVVRGTLRTFDLHPDGKRFAVLKAPAAQDDTKQDKIVFIFNFFDELRRIAPLGGKAAK